MKRALLAIFLASLGSAQRYRFPTSSADYSAFYPTAYRDVNSGAAVVDWNCGGISYAGHKGSDFGFGGFGGMAAGRDIAAAATGTVSTVYDGCADSCTSGTCGCGGGAGNHVTITHADGRVSWYMHLKIWSIPSGIYVGAGVSCGQKIGEGGSSGNSTGPHVHFEIRVAGSSQEPFSGPCGASSSSWVGQGPYAGVPSLGCDGVSTCEASTEVCNGADDDCDGTSDEGCDNDNDNYCDSGMTVIGTPGTCGGGGGDCDDGNAAIHPAAAEPCDAVDNNCAGGADDGCDDDNDGYCETGRSVVGTPPTCASGGGDCNDRDAALHPGATETCNCLDEDCDGHIDEEEACPFLAMPQEVSFPRFLRADEEVPVWVSFRNGGASAWLPSEVSLAVLGAQGVDLGSPEEWAAYDVPMTLEQVVQPGGIARFSFSLEGPPVEQPTPQQLALWPRHRAEWMRAECGTEAALMMDLEAQPAGTVRPSKKAASANHRGRAGVSGGFGCALVGTGSATGDWPGIFCLSLALFFGFWRRRCGGQ